MEENNNYNTNNNNNKNYNDNNDTMFARSYGVKFSSPKIDDIVDSNGPVFLYRKCRNQVCKTNCIIINIVTLACSYWHVHIGMFILACSYWHVHTTVYCRLTIPQLL